MYEVTTKKSTAAAKIQNMIKKAVVLSTSKKDTAFNDKVLDVVIEPKIIGSVAASDISTIIMNFDNVNEIDHVYYIITSLRSFVVDKKTFNDFFKTISWLSFILLMILITIIKF